MISAERMRAATAANRDVPDGSASVEQTCGEDVHISIFFDGTGNNKDFDEAEQKCSNIANIYEAANEFAQKSKKKTNYVVYVPGVGTPFNQQATTWQQNGMIWVEDLLGGGAGNGGDRRMGEGMDRVNRHLRDALIESATLLSGEAAKHAAKNVGKAFSDINAVLGKYRLIKMIDVSLFGFSRGAALARAFSNRLIARCSIKSGQLLYEGYPLRIKFMGLFDTVASFGVPAMNARTPFTERELIVPRAVERCVHYVAAHELRFSFPVDLIRKDGQLPENWIEEVLPGAHSDVGGGYCPEEQGIDNNYSRIPLRKMMREAAHCGVRLFRYDELEYKYEKLFRDRFAYSKNTGERYAKYMTECRAVGSVEEQIIAHMKMYYSAAGTMNRRGGETATDRGRRGNVLKHILGPKCMAAEIADYSLVREGKPDVQWFRLGGILPTSFAQYVIIQDWQYAAWNANASDNVIDFISKYVHDSKVDFLHNFEPYSYFMLRGVDESSISVWEESGSWLRTQGTRVTNTVNAATAAAEKRIQRITDVARSSVNKAVVVAQGGIETATRAGARAVDVAEEEFDRLTENGRRWFRARIGDM